MYFVFDEDGNALGYIIVPHGMDINEVDVWDLLMPFAVPPVKDNPKTGHELAIDLVCLTPIFVVAFAILIQLKRRMFARLSK
jgi:hypothetical protein